MQLLKGKNGKAEEKPLKNGNGKAAACGWSGYTGLPTKSRL